MTKAKINKMIVMDQIKDLDAGRIEGMQTCGYHVFKNSLLNLMLHQGLINESQFATMLLDNKLFTAIYRPNRVIRDNGDVDASMPQVQNMIEKARTGQLDLAKHGISSDTLKKLQLKQDGTEGLSVVNMYTGLGFSSEYAQLGMEDDLASGAMVAKLARNKGVQSHVFAFGLNNEHWVSASFQQNAKGERTWRFMNSLENSDKFKTTVVDAVETILKKTEPELKAYLLAVYGNASDLFNRRYNAFFDTNGAAKPGKISGFGQGGLESRDTNEEFVSARTPCALVKMSKNPLTCSYNEIDKLIQCENTIILYNNELFFADRVTQSVEKIIITTDKQADFNQLKLAIGDSAKLADITQLKLIESVTGSSFKKNLAEYVTLIENRFNFLQTADWLNSKGKEETVNIKKLYAVANFIIQHTSTDDLADIEAKRKLAPICERLESSLGLLPKPIIDVSVVPIPDTVPLLEPSIALDPVLPEETPVELEIPPSLENIDIKEEEERQAKAAQFAAENQKPQATEGFFDSFVRAIKSFFAKIKEAFEYLAESIRASF